MKIFFSKLSPPTVRVQGITGRAKNNKGRRKVDVLSPVHLLFSLLFLATTKLASRAWDGSLLPTWIKNGYMGTGISVIFTNNKRRQGPRLIVTRNDFTGVRTTNLFLRYTLRKSEYHSYKQHKCSFPHHAGLRS